MALLGPDGQAIRRQALRREEAGPTTTGVRHWLSGHPSHGLTPQRLAAILREAEEGDPTRFLELAEDLEEKDGQYAAVLRQRKLAVAEMEVTVVAAGEDAEAVRDADLLRAWLDTGVLDASLVDLLDGLGKGFAVAEILWDMDDGAWLPAQLAPRDPRWFGFDLEDGRTIRLRDVNGMLIPLAPAKFVTHVPQLKSGLPIRGGLARPAAWAWLFKSFSLKDWVIFAETYAMPLRLGKYPAGSSEADRQALMSAVAQLGADAAAVVPADMVVEFVRAEGSSASADIYKRLVEYMDQQVSKVVLGQTTTTDAVSGGHAVSREHNEVREELSRADARQLSATLTRDLARVIVSVNHGVRRHYPRILVQRPDEEDVGQMVDWVRHLVPLGLPVPEWWMRDKLGIPEREADDVMLGAPRSADVPSADGGTGEDADAGETPALQSTAAGRQADLIDQAVDRLLADGEDPMPTALLGLVLDAADRAGSYEEFLSLLAGIAGSAPENAALIEALDRAGFAARLAGRVGFEG